MLLLTGTSRTMLTRIGMRTRPIFCGAVAFLLIVGLVKAGALKDDAAAAADKPVGFAAAGRAFFERRIAHLLKGVEVVFTFITYSFIVGNWEEPCVNRLV